MRLWLPPRWDRVRTRTIGCCRRAPGLDVAPRAASSRPAAAAHRSGWRAPQLGSATPMHSPAPEAVRRAAARSAPARRGTDSGKVGQQNGYLTLGDLVLALALGGSPGSGDQLRHGQQLLHIAEHRILDVGGRHAGYSARVAALRDRLAPTSRRWALDHKSTDSTGAPVAGLRDKVGGRTCCRP